MHGGLNQCMFNFYSSFHFLSAHSFFSIQRVEVRDKKLDEFELIAGKPLKTITLSAFCSFTVLEDWNMLCDRSPVSSESKIDVLGSS